MTQPNKAFNLFALAFTVLAVAIAVSGCSGIAGETITSTETETQPSGPPTDTPIPTDTPVPTPPPEVVADVPCFHVDAQGDDGENQEDEWICLKNEGDLAADMTGWTVVDDYGWTYTFPEFTLAPGSTVRLITGCGTDTTGSLHWCKGGSSAVWNNDTDTVHLYDPAGNLLVEHSY